VTFQRRELRPFAFSYTTPVCLGPGTKNFPALRLLFVSYGAL
jgi:hypothetical protein